MDKKWEINRVSTPERIFDKIKTEMAQPVGIVFFGADCDFKNEVLDAMVEELRGFDCYYTEAPDTAALMKAIQVHSAVAVTLNSEESSMHSLRQELVKAMRNAGAKTVVGVYAKSEKIPIRSLTSSLEDAKFNRQVAAIKRSNPTADGLDYFVVVGKEGEEREVETTRILWSGLTGRTGLKAMKVATDMPDISIVMGVSRRDMSGIIDIDGQKFEEVKWWQYQQIQYNCFDFFGITSGVDVIVDFSNSQVFDEILDLAIRTRKPFISGTSGLSDRQMASLYDATNRIPIFRDGNFRFRLKKFIDDAVELAMTTPGDLTLYEHLYGGKSLPSETSRVIQRRIYEATGKHTNVHSSASFGKKNLVCDWRIGDLHCRTTGLNELARDVLEIAKVMAKKPVKKGEFYDLDELWDDLMW